jgi:hypothetical protein
MQYVRYRYHDKEVHAYGLFASDACIPSEWCLVDYKLLSMSVISSTKIYTRAC